MSSAAYVLLVSGSLRQVSTNTAALRTAMVMSPAGVRARLYDGLASLPAFNPDDEAGSLAKPAAELRAGVRAADALFSVPEYAGGLPGAFKNLLDWLIGDDRPRSLYEKPVGWINVSPRGAVHAYDSLRIVLSYANALVVEEACVHVPISGSGIDAAGLVADPAADRQIVEALAAVAARAVGQSGIEQPRGR
jgi:NAD(P)H-dependent FMN reductase